MTIMDGLRNIVASLGTDRDKAAHTHYYNTTITDDQLVAMYRTSAIARNVVDLPAEDATREWREWQADAEQITAIEAEEKRLGLQGKTMQNLKRARLFGGAAIYIGTRDLDASKPLDPARIGKGGLQYLAVLNRSEITAGQIQRDPRLPGFGKPIMYTMNPATGASVPIHPSRLVIAAGEEVPDDRYSAYPGWGDSTLNATISAVRNLDATIANVASLVFEAKVDVIGIKGFTDGLQYGGDSYETMVTNRTSLTARGKGINGALLMDADDTYDQKNASFATLPDIIDRFMQMVSAAAGVPMTRLFGISAAGMNATGAGDEKVYFDRVRVMQTLDLDPAMEILNECLIRSALGNRPPELHWNWRPLFQPTAKERADMGKVLVDSVKVLYDMDILPQEALADTIVNTLTESGAFPGLEGKVKEFYGGNDGDDGDLMVTPPVRVPAVVADAAPQTLYVRRDVLNSAEITAWAKSQGFTAVVTDLHITIAYSTTPVDWFKVGTSYSDKMEMPSGGPRLMERLGPTGEYIALLITANEIVWRNQEIRDAGASWSWPDYQPHISIQIGGDIDLTNVKPYQGKIILGPEIFEAVRLEADE